MSKIKETSTNFANKQALFNECLEVYASNIIGGQWSLAICCYLVNGKLRFGELKNVCHTSQNECLRYNCENWKKVKS